ncbi:unnamed protein product [Mucor circinelloides]|uniref:MARVEL domain-containing protein n=1 Tax=Mucor circinelloides f. circinelloides (strain 1006PhL) TaxID=1220926 RepID=S2JN58_MUCC1|nr:hypothetical protein HMPREF1544_03180 [Mucor circinelloides 1006PhL]
MFVSKNKIKNIVDLDVLSTCLNLIGFILMILCLLSSAHPSLSSLYFIKASNDQHSAAFGLFHYCVNGQQCQQETFTLPFDEQMLDLLNVTTTTPAQDPNPPSHDPHMLVAFICCLLCSGISIVLCLYKLTNKRYYDIHFTRGFLSVGASLWSLLLVTLTSITFQHAATAEQSMQHFEIEIGPCMSMVGCAFMVFSLASSVLLFGCATTTATPSHPHSYYHNFV